MSLYRKYIRIKEKVLMKLPSILFLFHSSIKNKVAKVPSNIFFLQIIEACISLQTHKCQGSRVTNVEIDSSDVFFTGKKFTPILTFTSIKQTFLHDSYDSEHLLFIFIK